ncbi:hypothetical protein E2C01_028239 [Portunus trituberculatus]|uniref:Uncharacterized protein n=1 Tax=Portunus trituberculatus TaxID=210409 RepID=A0A5B7ENI6_PORTR|nr:hypothetical protein [Portunus trituberculatus]
MSLLVSATSSYVYIRSFSNVKILLRKMAHMQHSYVTTMTHTFTMSQEHRKTHAMIQHCIQGGLPYTHNRIANCNFLSAKMGNELVQNLLFRNYGCKFFFLHHQSHIGNTYRLSTRIVTMFKTGFNDLKGKSVKSPPVTREMADGTSRS